MTPETPKRFLRVLSQQGTGYGMAISSADENKNDLSEHPQNQSD